MMYEDALEKWGRGRLEAVYNKTTTGRDYHIAGPITVRMNFNEGYACCGGTNPDCYCSFAESPSADVRISDASGLSVIIDHDDFDFGKILGEIIEAGGGTVSK